MVTLRKVLRPILFVGFVAYTVWLWSVPDSVLAPYWPIGLAVTGILFLVTYRRWPPSQRSVDDSPKD